MAFGKKKTTYWNRELEEARIDVDRLIAIEREQMRQAREQERQKAEQARQNRDMERYAREQMRQAKELEKHEQWLRKHDEEIAKLQFKVEQAERDIEHLRENVSNLYALLDYVNVELDQAIVGGKNQFKLQKQAITLTNQIHVAESRLNKATFDRDQAKKKLEVA